MPMVLAGSSLSKTQAVVMSKPKGATTQRALGLGCVEVSILTPRSLSNWYKEARLAALAETQTGGRLSSAMMLGSG